MSLKSFDLKRQITVISKNEIDQIKNGYTHVVVDSTILLGSDEYMDAFKKYWTVTKGIDFVKQEDLKENLVLGDTYFCAGEERGTYSNGAIVSDLMIGLWTPKDRAVRKKQEFSSFSEHLLASIILTKNVRSRKAGASTDGTGPIGYWTPGNLKNYIQQLNAAFLAGKKLSINDDITDKEQLKLLQNQSLYCTPDIFYETNNHNRDKFIQEIFEDYKYAYKIISPTELSDKIIADKEPFYYLIYLHNEVAGKIIIVVNSRTGKLIYSRKKVSLSFHIKSKDLKEIYKETE